MLVSELHEGVVLRLLRQTDAPSLLDAYVRNRRHLAEWDPARTDSFYTLESMTRRLETSLGRLDAGLTVPWVLVRDEVVLGTVTLDGVVRGAACSAALGYWVDSAVQGRGVATAAVAAVCDAASSSLRLHRLQASTLPHNERSQRVLARNGFERIGFAPAYLHIAGRWQDHALFQRVLSDAPPEPAPETPSHRG